MPQALKPCPDPSRATWVAHFGGSFNPIHAGHIALARVMLDRYGFARAVFCPNGSRYPKRGLASEQDRFALVRAAIAHEPRFSVSDFELGRDTLVRTLHTIEHLLDTLHAPPNAPLRLFVVRGGDAIAKMRRWGTLDALLEKVEVVAIPREGADVDAAFAEHPRLKAWEHRFFTASAEGVPTVSSTEVREMLQRGQQPPTSMLPRVVFDAIQRRELYGA